MMIKKMSNNYERCFEKHSFDFLNNIDLYKFQLLSKYLDFGKDDQVFFDVGCNGGSFVRYLENNRITKNIHCFEPHPILSKTVLNTYPFVIMNEICVSNYNGDITINIPTWSVGISSVIRRPVFDTLNQDINELVVKCKTLDSYCEENNVHQIDFIKIDVEGAEKMVFEGAHNLLSNHSIKCGMFEIGQTLIDAGTSTDEVSKLIESYGYKLDKNLSPEDYIFYL